MGGLSEKIHGVKVSTGSLASWEFPESTAQPTLFSHSLILLFRQNYVLLREGCLSAADAALTRCSVHAAPASPSPLHSF